MQDDQILKTKGGAALLKVAKKTAYSTVRTGKQPALEVRGQ